MVFAEAGGTNSTCRKAIAKLIQGRTSSKYFKKKGQDTCCEVVTALKPGKEEDDVNPYEFDAVGTERYKTCCEGKSMTKSVTDKKTKKKVEVVDAIEEDRKKQVFEDIKDLTGVDIDGAEYYHDKSMGTPPWIVRKIAKGEMSDVIVSGCYKFRFYKVVEKNNTKEAKKKSK